MVVDLPESTWPMTTTLMWVFSLGLQASLVELWRGVEAPLRRLKAGKQKLTPW